MTWSNTATVYENRSGSFQIINRTARTNRTKAGLELTLWSALGIPSTSLSRVATYGGPHDKHEVSSYLALV
jgi:hypothetical protein